MGERRTRAARTRATVDRIIVAARTSFAAHGYDATFLDAIVEDAGVTKGALYHHFESKRDLFAAVYEVEQRAIGHAVATRARGRGNTWQKFLRGCDTFFDAVLDPGVQRITLIDAPAVLGWQRMRDLEDSHVTSLLRAGLTHAMADGHLKSQPVDPLAHLIHGAMCEAAMTVARAANPTRQAGEASTALRHLLNGIALRPPR